MTDDEQSRINAAAERHDRLTLAAQTAPRGYKLRTDALLSSACLERMAAELEAQRG